MSDISADDHLIWNISTGARLTCIKSALTESDQSEVFTAGKAYTVESMHPIADPAYVRLTNNQGESHKMMGEHIREFFRY